ncbi:MAG: homocysteine S-methyltransferase family protein, partial [Proteobacteria bacterium]|nr:homocysteine S-methyltransferase family protein [Pseudomonadota bacterium]
MAGRITLLDGGMGRELKRMGAPFRQPQWSALALMEAPDFVSKAHAAFIAAGAEVVTTNSYAVVPFHIGRDRFAADGRMLAERAGRLARAAADDGAGRKVLVAASLPPLFGSYRPDLFDAARAPGLLRTLVEGLSPHADLWLAETLGSIAEAAAVNDALAGDARPLWISFTLAD